MIPAVGEAATVFSATHLGDPFQIIVFYKSELPVHVDYQYQEPSDLVPRAKGRNAFILLDRTGDVHAWREACQQMTDDDSEGEVRRVQYLEDRFWAWCWYGQGKLQLGELWEARDTIEYLRTEVLVALARTVLGGPYEGNRRLERRFPSDVLRRLDRTVPDSHSKESYEDALSASVDLYLHLFGQLAEVVRGTVRPVDREYFKRFLPGPGRAPPELSST